MPLLAIDSDCCTIIFSYLYNIKQANKLGEILTQLVMGFNLFSYNNSLWERVFLLAYAFFLFYTLPHCCKYR